MTTAPTPPRLETDRLWLEPISERDLEDVFHLYGDAEVVRYFGQDRMADLTQARFWLSVQAHMRQTGLGMTWCLRDKLDNQLVGTACFDGINRHWHNVGTSYALNRAYWNRGYASEALAAMISLAFDGGLDCPIHRIQALVFPANLPSSRMLSRLGFVHEGRRLGLLFWQERYWDLDSYCLLNRTDS